MLEAFTASLRDLCEGLPDVGARHTRLLKSLTLVLTTACNLRCSYCCADRKDGRMMAWDVVQGSLDLLRRAGRPRPKVLFFGGEPLLAMPMIRRAVAYAGSTWPPDEAPRYVVSTNGTLLGCDEIEYLVEHDVRVQLSSDGVEEAQRARGDGTFAFLDGLLQRLAHDHPAFLTANVGVKLTLTARNLPYLAASIRYLVRRGVSRIGVVPLLTHDADWEPESISRLDEQLEQVRRFSVEQWLRTRETPFTQLRRPMESGDASRVGSSMCAAGQGSELVVDVDGTAAACSSLLRSVQSVRSALHGELLDVARVSDVRDPEFKKDVVACRERIREHPVFNHRRAKRSSYGECRECEALATCFVCPHSIAHIPGNTDPHLVPDNQCGFNLVLARQRELFEAEIGRAGDGEVDEQVPGTAS